jgi:hypothetical protein
MEGMLSSILSRLALLARGMRAMIYPFDSWLFCRAGICDLVKPVRLQSIWKKKKPRAGAALINGKGDWSNA